MALPNADDGIRAPSGVVVSLRPTSEGRLCVVLDDVRQQPAADARSWTHESFFTVSEYSRRELENLDLSKDQFAQIGENISYSAARSFKGRQIPRWVRCRIT